MRRSILKWFALFLLGCLIPVVAVACNSPQAATPDSDSNSKPLMVGASPWAGFQGQYIAAAKDFFGEENVKVEEQYFQSTSDVNTALAAGKLDLGWIGGTDLITLVAQNPSLKAIMLSDYSNGADGILVRGVSQPADLKGKTLSREDAPYALVFVGEYLKQGGLTEKDVKIVSLSAADSATAFAAGKVDAAATYEPFLTKALKEGKGEIVFTTQDTNIIPNLLAARGEVLEQRREEVLAYMRAIDKGVDLAQSSPDEAAEIVAQKLGITPEEIPAQLAGIKTFDITGNQEQPFNASDPLYLQKSFESAVQILHDTGKISTTVDAASLIDDSLIKSL